MYTKILACQKFLDCKIIHSDNKIISSFAKVINFLKHLDLPIICLQFPQYNYSIHFLHEINPFMSSCVLFILFRIISLRSIHDGTHQNFILFIDNIVLFHPQTVFQLFSYLLSIIQYRMWLKYFLRKVNLTEGACFPGYWVNFESYCLFMAKLYS